MKVRSNGRTLGAIFIAASVATRQLRAQEVRGTVRDTATNQPVVSVVLLVLDSAGMTLGRTLSDARGSYRFTMAPSFRTLRVVRIGFRPREITLPAVLEGPVQLDIAMSAIPTLLDPVQVKAGATCSRRDDRIIALSLLEQARAGLLATVVAREARPADMIRLTYRQGLDRSMAHVESQQVRVDSSGNVAVAFEAARKAAEFVEKGFARADGEAQTFFGPDAETLLDDDFRDGYCFRLRDPQRDRPNQVGLGFEPAKTKKDRIDIDGTLWIDTSARAIKEIAYDYVGLDRRLDPVHPGGNIRFRALANGVMIIDEWHFRLPWVEERPTFNGRVISRGVLRARENGGVVASATWPDGFSWAPPLGSVRIHAVDREGHSLPGRVITLDSTDYSGTTDAAGVVDIARLLPGPYRAFAGDTLLEQLGLHARPSLSFTATAGLLTEQTLVVPTPIDFVRQECADGRTHIDSSGVWLLGRVVGTDARPVPNAEFRLYIRETDGWREAGDASGKTGTTGVLPYCGNELQPNTQVRLEARRSARDQWVSLSFVPKRRLTTIVVALPPGRAP